MNDDNAPVVHMGVVLELLEKSVVHFGQYIITITPEKHYYASMIHVICSDLTCFACQKLFQTLYC